MSVVLHVPHASTAIPDDVRRGIELDDAALARELLASSDHHTDRFVAGLDALAPPGAPLGRVAAFVNAHSRLVVDPERFLDPAREATEAVGRGAVYTRGFDGTLLRDADAPGFAALRADLIERFFTPYHAGFEQLVAGMLDASGPASGSGAGTCTCTVIDVHSYPSVAQPYELAGGLPADAVRPELCIGTDEVHTPAWLVAVVEDAAAACGFSTARDTPFAGTFVPTPWLGDARVRSVMLEIRRDTYMDEATGELHADGAERCRALVRRVVEGVLAHGSAGAAREVA